MIDSDDYGSLYHELKNYISFLNSTLQLYELRHENLSNDPQWAETKHISKRILNISNALPMCDLESNFYPTLTNVMSFFHKFLRDFETNYEDDEFRLTISAEDDLPDMFFDPTQLRLALNLLVDNAYDAIDCCGDIFLKAFSKDNHLIITLKDFGCGLPCEDVERIFKPGFTTKEDSLGLGLTIARSAIQLLGGTITARNNNTCGSMFIIRFPIRTC